MTKSSCSHREFSNRKNDYFHLIYYLTLWPDICHLYWQNLSALGKSLLIFIVFLTSTLSYQVYQLVSHQFHDQFDFFIIFIFLRGEILHPSLCIMHDDLLDPMYFRTKNLLPYPKQKAMNCKLLCKL